MANRRRCHLPGVVVLSCAAGAGLLALRTAFVPPQSFEGPRQLRPITAATGVGLGFGSLMLDAGAAPEDAAAGIAGKIEEFFSLPEGTTPVDIFFKVFYVGIFIALFKNNLVDGNGPLAGLFGQETASCTASHILVDTDEKVQEVAAKLKGTTSIEQFAELAKEHSTCPSGKKGGQMGKIGKGELDPVFDKICFDEQRPVGVAHGPFTSKYGKHFFWIEERREGNQKSLVSP